jgi:GNAT superfamily N-acetyltransferase
MSDAWHIEEVPILDEQTIDGLTQVLLDCVEAGASVGFMLPLEHNHARRFWENMAWDVAAGGRVLLVARDAAGICGTVQLIHNQPDNQPHRAQIAKMQVHRRARRRGLGAALMRAAEAAALTRGRHLLVLDAVTGGDGARLYERLGWTRVGDIPDFALWPRGGYVGTTYYYRDLRGPDLN